MIHYVYYLPGDGSSWTFAGDRPDEVAAKQLCRDLWRAGALGVRVRTMTTVFEQMR